jgi:hypothetical protein
MLIKLQIYPNVKYYDIIKTILDTYKLHILNTNLVNNWKPCKVKIFVVVMVHYIMNIPKYNILKSLYNGSQLINF